ncbi:MAG TPA: L-threonylcarbamoyladenylate synthase [Bacteroidales bacterium]|nr:L-threonylcarbamoyladenylate synthase [Bacteroidales bacterium]
MTFAEDIQRCLDALRKGGTIIYPTDTIWGLGCDATDVKAVEKIFSIKAREESKSLLILVSSIGMLERYVTEIPSTASRLIEVSDDPLTIIYPHGKNLAPGVCSSDGSVGIRICNDDFCNELISRFRKPLVSTSANFSGMPSPSKFSQIDEGILNNVDYVVNYRRGDKKASSPSSIIKVGDDGTFSIIRK